MDRNDLLAASRAEFLRVFLKSAEESLPLAFKELAKKAEACSVSGERAQLLSARRVLMDREGELTLEFKKNMEQLLNRSFQTTYSTFRPSFSSTYSSSSLSLIDASAFEDELRIKEITNQFRNVSEDQLRDLNIRIALLFEQENIQERENPFRPYLFARCIATVIESLREPPEINAILLQQFAESMVDTIDEIYSCVNAHLAKNGIAAQLQLKISKSRTRYNISADRPVEYVNSQGNANDAFTGSPRIVAHHSQTAPLDHKMDQLIDAIKHMVSGLSVQDNGASKTEKTISTEPDGATKAEWLAENQVLSDALKKFFSGAPSPSITQSGPGENPGNKIFTPAANTVATENIGSAPGADKANTKEESNELRNLLLEFRSSAEGAKLNASEQMTTDILGMLFEFILHDEQVPKAIRAQIGRLQFVILKRALHDTALLKQKDHPVRKLIDRIATISLGLQQLDPNIVHVTAEVQRIVELMLADETGDVSLPINALDDFNLFVTREFHASTANVAQAMQLAEKAQSLARQFIPKTSLMNQALTGLTVDTYLRDFLEQTWVLAIDMVDETDIERAKRFRLLVPELLWSSVPKANPEDRKQLFTLLPTILNTIREGLTLIGWTAAKQQDFLNWLVDVHTKALRVGNVALVSPSLLWTYQHFEKFIAPSTPKPAPKALEGDPADDRTFLNEAIRELRINVRQLDHIFDVETGAATSEIALPAMPTAPKFDIEARLACGVPIEITIGMPQLGLLIWTSPKLSYLVLALANDAKPSTISVKLFQQLLVTGQIHFLEPSPLFERAVLSLLTSADGIDKPNNKT